MRLLHVLDRAGPGKERDWNVCAWRAMTADAPDHDHTTALIGSGTDEERARSLGLRAQGRINPMPRMGVRMPLRVRAHPGLRAFVRDRGPFDRILHWEGVACRSGRRVVHLGDLPSDQVPLLGAPGDAADHRAAWRARLGLDSGEIVVGMIGHADSPHAVLQMLWACGLVDSTGRGVTALLSTGPPARALARRLQSDHSPFGDSRLARMVVTDEPEPLTMHAADILIVCPRQWRTGAEARHEGSQGSDPALLLAAAASGIPTIAPRSPAGEAVLDSTRLRARLTLTGTQAEIARAITALADENRRRNTPASGPFGRGFGATLLEIFEGAPARQ